MDKLRRNINNYIHEKQYKNIDNILVSKKGEVIFSQNYNKDYANRKHYIASIIKSIVSLGVGIAVREGYLSIDDPINEYLPEYFKNTSEPMHRKITIRNLLTQSSGIYWQFGIHASQPLWSRICAEEDWISAIAELPIVNTPGKKFYYKEIDVYLLIQILQKVSNMSIEEYIYNYLYNPLNIVCDSLDKSMGINNHNTNNISKLTVDEMAIIGNFCLNGGKIDGVQIVDEDFLKMSTKKQIDTIEFVDKFGTTDYGFLWWIFGDAYFARGFGGNEIAIFPDQDLVIVIQATAKKVSKEYLDVIFDIILKDKIVLGEKR